MTYNAGISKEVNKAYENNAGLNINRDIERLKDFAKAMGHIILEDQSGSKMSLVLLRDAFRKAMCEYMENVKDYFALVGDIRIIYLNTDKGYVATTINGQYPFYFEDDDLLLRAFTQASTGEFVQCYARKNSMWSEELPYMILFANSLSNVKDIIGTERGVDIYYKSRGGSECYLSACFDYKRRIIKGKDSERGISFKNAMERGSRVSKWLYHNAVWL